MTRLIAMHLVAAAGFVAGAAFMEAHVARPGTLERQALLDSIVARTEGVRLVPAGTTTVAPADAAPHQGWGNAAGCVAGPRDCGPYVAPVPLPWTLPALAAALAALGLAARRRPTMETDR